MLDPRVQATLTALEELFEADTRSTIKRPPDHGPAMGRYANDPYYSGGAWYLATLAAAEFYFKLAAALRSGADWPSTSENTRFRQRLGRRGVQGRPLSGAATRSCGRCGPTHREWRPLGAIRSLTTGAQTSAKHLSWSYAAFITAAASRRRAAQAIPG